MSPRVRAALGKVERHRLVPPEQRALAYRNHPLPIGQGQTISQPYIVALSTDLIAPQPQHVVLEVGTGSGYQAAVLAETVQKVYSIELLESLAHGRGRALEELRISTTSKSRSATATRAGRRRRRSMPSWSRPPRRGCRRRCIEQLKPGGRLVIPVGEAGGAQDLLLIVKTAEGKLERKSILPVRFVPLVPGR